MTCSGPAIIKSSSVIFRQILILNFLFKNFCHLFSLNIWIQVFLLYGICPCLSCQFIVIDSLSHSGITSLHGISLLWSKYLELLNTYWHFYLLLISSNGTTCVLTYAPT